MGNLGSKTRSLLLKIENSCLGCKIVFCNNFVKSSRTRVSDKGPPWPSCFILIFMLILHASYLLAANEQIQQSLAKTGSQIRKS
jgi:hypothetical protein